MNIVEIWNQIINNAPVLVGFVMPWIIEVFVRQLRSETEKTITAITLCVVAAVLLHWHDIAYGTPEQVFTFAGIIFLESQSVYAVYFKGSSFQTFIRSPYIPFISRKEPLEVPVTSETNP